jgi:site-specific recombinase XerD
MSQMQTPTEPDSPSYRIRIAPTNDGSGRRGPPDLSPREALERWLDKLRVDKADSTVSSYHYRLKHFVEWCEDEGIVSISEITGWDLEEFELHRRERGMKAITLNKELGTLQNFLEYCGRIELVDDDLHKKVDPPDVSKNEEVDKTRLHPDDARMLLNCYDNNPEIRHSRAHALLKLTWFVGCRLGGLLALDLKHYNPEDRTLEFVHDADTETPLKNTIEGQRVVALQEEVCDVLDEYIEKNRHSHVHDDYGRSPLFTSEDGRPSENSIRAWTYMATFPCIHSECPHGEDPEICEYIDYSKGSQCPSSRSPHQVRTGSITWQLNQGVPIEVVAKRVNASVRTIKKHYDQPDMHEEMERRRRPHVDNLSLNEGGED